jgi:hypothetical protein
MEVAWLYGPVKQRLVNRLSPNPGGLTNTLSGNGGFPPGGYSLVISSEAKGFHELLR